MKGHFKKLKRGYAFRVDIGYDQVTGKRKQKQYSGYKTLEEAKAAFHKVAIELYEKTFLQPNEITVEDYLKNWIESVKFDIAASTLRGYKVNIFNHIIPHIGHIKLQELRLEDVKKMYFDLQSGNEPVRKAPDEKRSKKPKILSRTTVRYIHATLRTALNDAVGTYLKTNILEGKKIAPKPAYFEAQFLTEEEVKKLLELFEGTDFYTPVLLAVGLGLRRGEALGLLWDCVNFAKGTITVKRSYIPKQGEGHVLAGLKTLSSSRTLTVPKTIMEYLHKIQEKQKDDKKYFGTNYFNGNFVCCKSDGTPISPHAWNKKFQRTLANAGFRRVRIHDLRHTNASLMILHNTPMKVVSERLGHSSIKITMDLYGHIYNEQQEEIACKLDETLNFLKNVHNNVHE